MSYVVDLSIGGLNGRKRPIEIDLDRHVNVIFGANGSGKTGVLKVIHSAMREDSNLIRRTSLKSAMVRIYTKDYDKKISFQLINYEENELAAARKNNILDLPPELIAEIASARPPQSRWKLTGLSQDEDKRRAGRWRHFFLPTTRLYQPDSFRQSELYLNTSLGTSGATAAMQMEESIDKNFANAVQTLWRTKYGNILTRVRSIQQKALQEIFLQFLEVDTTSNTSTQKKSKNQPQLVADRAFDRMSNFLKRQAGGASRQALESKADFMQRFNTDARLRRIVDQIDVVEAQIEEEMRPIEKLSEVIRKLFSGKKAMSFDGPTISASTEDGTPLGLDLLSSGEKHLLRILLAALEADDNLLMIDEPELSLHIDWQRDLIATIRTLNPNCQLLLATHSPEIMADVHDRNIFKI
jgi:predicted ATPase